MTSTDAAATRREQTHQIRRASVESVGIFRDLTAITRWPLCLALAFCFAGGCGQNSDRKTLTDLLNAIAKDVQAKIRDKDLKGFGEDQRRICFFAQYHRDEVDTINRFVVPDPPFSPRAKEAVLGLKSASERLARLYESLLAEKRFTLTDDEIGWRDEWQTSFQSNLVKIGRLIDGRE